MEEKNRIMTDNVTDYKFLVIKNNDISNINWNNINYPDIISNLEIYEFVTLNNDSFVDITKKYLYNHLYVRPSIHTELICVGKNYFYELLFVEEINEQNIEKLNDYDNMVARMLNNKHKNFFNALLIKTSINIDTNDMKFLDIDKTDIKNILYDRVYPKVVIFDEKWKETRIDNGNLIKYCEDFFDDAPACFSNGGGSQNFGSGLCPGPLSSRRRDSLLRLCFCISVVSLSLQNPLPSSTALCALLLPSTSLTFIRAGFISHLSWWVSLSGCFSFRRLSSCSACEGWFGLG